jgi:hypothetical protein
MRRIGTILGGWSKASLNGEGCDCFFGVVEVRVLSVGVGSFI